MKRIILTLLFLSGAVFAQDAGTGVLYQSGVKADGSNPLTADWSAGPYTITANAFVGDGSGLTGVTGNVAYAQSVTVAKSGADFTTVQAAVDSITDSATDKRYAILISPGTYTENVDLTGKPYISLIGVGGHEATKITSASGTTLKMAATGDAEVRGLQILSTPTASGAICLDVDGGEVDLYSCYLKMTSATNDITGTLLDIDGAEVKCDGDDFVYTMSGTHANAQTHNVIDMGGNFTLLTHGGMMDIDVADENDAVRGVYDSGTGTGRLRSLSSEIDINLSNVAYSGAATGMLIGESSGDHRIISTHIHMNSDGNGTGVALALDSNGNARTLSSVGNTLDVTGFTTNYGATADTGDTITISNDTVNAADSVDGSGSVEGIWVGTEGANRLKVKGTTPLIELYEDIAGTDNKRVQIQQDNNQFRIRLHKDDGTNGSTVMLANRTNSILDWTAFGITGKVLVNQTASRTTARLQVTGNDEAAGDLKGILSLEALTTQDRLSFGVQSATEAWIRARDVNGTAFLPIGVYASQFNVHSDTAVTGKINTNTSEDTDSDTDDVLSTGIAAGYGLLIVRESTGTEACTFLIAGQTIEKVTTDATFTVTKDNAATYNVYWDTDQFKVQNKVGDDKNIRVALYGM